MGIEWDDRGSGLYHGRAEGIHLSVSNWDSEPGWGITMWGARVPEDRQYPSERYRTAGDAMTAAEEIVAGLPEDSD